MKIIQLATSTISLALITSAPAGELFNVDFESNSSGDNYTVVSGTGTDTNLVGTAPSNITSVNNTSGSWSATVDVDKDLIMTATDAAGYGGFNIFTPQAAPVTPETWYLEFDYTRLASTGGILAVNFLNASGQNMLGHSNNGTFYSNQFIAAGGGGLVVDSTYTFRIEIDSGTTDVRTYIDGAEYANPLIAANTTSFGGINVHFISATATDFVFDNIKGGTMEVVPEPSSFVLLGLAGLGMLAWGRRK